MQPRQLFRCAKTDDFVSCGSSWASEGLVYIYCVFNGLFYFNIPDIEMLMITAAGILKFILYL